MLIVLMCPPIHHTFVPDSFSGQAGLPVCRSSSGCPLSAQMSLFPGFDTVLLLLPTPLALPLFSLNVHHLLTSPTSTIDMRQIHHNLARASYSKVITCSHRSSTAHWGMCLYSPHISELRLNTGHLMLAGTKCSFILSVTVYLALCSHYYNFVFRKLTNLIVIYRPNVST